MTRLPIPAALLCLALAALVGAAESPPVPATEVEEAEQFVLKVYGNKDETAYAEAAEAYLELVGQLDARLDKQDRAIVERHAAQAVLVAPEPVRQHVVASGPRARMLKFNERAGAALVAWWRSQDALPATVRNERLDKHLERVAEALTRFASPKQQMGVDDRGEVYIRLGQPSTTAPVQLDTYRLQRMLRRATLDTFGSMTPPTCEFWDYRHISENTYFLFVKQGTYRLGQPSDLIPDFLLKNTNRGGNFVRDSRESAYGVVLMEAYRLLYTDLATLHPDFQEYLDDVDTYQTETSGTPKSYAQSLNNRFSVKEINAERERLASTPQVYAPVVEDLDPLLVDARVARFLNPDGSTRAELYWSHRPGSLTPPARRLKDLASEGYETFDQYFLQLVTVRNDGDYTGRTEFPERYLAADLPPGSGATVQSQIIEGRPDLFHLNMQWNQHVYAVDGEAGELVVGPQVKLGLVRADSLWPLNAAPDRLEISDLKPIYLPDGLDSLAEDTGSGTPFPISVITPGTPLALYFELYHLTFDANDQTRYTVELEVARHTPKPLLRLRERDADRTSVSTRLTGSSRTAQEHIVLDLQEWEGRGTLEVTVRVTDETTGQRVERSLQFDLSTV